MADVFSKAKRSAVMAAIKGRGTKTTEIALRRLMRRDGLRGWRAHLADLPGRPDFAFVEEKVAVFVDGCFWHGCTRCSRNMKPATNTTFWSEKIVTNRKRDRRVGRRLRAEGWKVLRVWEHDLRKRPENCIARIRSAMNR